MPVREPGRARHRPGLVRRPEPEYQTAPQLGAMLVENPRQFHHAGVAGRVVGRRLAIPGILVTTDKNKVARTVDRHLSDRQVNVTPAIVDVGLEVDLDGALLK